MLLQTNSYIVPEDRRAEHARMVRRFRQALLRIGCDQFEVYEQVGANWSPGGSSGRFVQIMRFRDRQHQQAVQVAERNDPGAQQIIAEFCDLINFPYQQQHGYFSTGFYVGLLPTPARQALGFEPAGETSSTFGAEFVESEATAEEQAPQEEEASEFEESQEETAADPESGVNEEPIAETDLEPTAEAESDEQPAEIAPDEELLAEAELPQDAALEPSLEEAETEALAEGEATPENAPADEAIPEAEATPEPSGDAEIPAEIPMEIADDFQFDLETPPAETPAQPSMELAAPEPESPSVVNENEIPPASEPTPPETPEERGAALVSFLDSLTQEDLVADESVANEVDAEGHIREVDPAAAEQGFADEAIAPPALEPQAADEVVTADEFAPAESTPAPESEPEMAELFSAEAEVETETAPVAAEEFDAFAEDRPAAEAEPLSESAPQEQSPVASFDALEPEAAVDTVTADEFAPAESAATLEFEPEMAEVSAETSVETETAFESEPVVEAEAAPANGEDFDIFAEEQPAVAIEPLADFALEEHVPSAATHEAIEEVANLLPPEGGEAAAMTSDQPEAEFESFSVFEDDADTNSDVDHSAHGSESHPSDAVSFDPIFDDPHLRNHAPGAAHEDMNVLPPEHPSHDDGHEAISQNHAHGETEEHSIDFDAFLTELEDPSAGPAHR